MPKTRPRPCSFASIRRSADARRHARPLRPATDFTARLPFPEPLITHEGVMAGLDYLAEELCAMLARKGRGARRFGPLALPQRRLFRRDRGGLERAVARAEASPQSVQGQDRGDRHGLRRRPHGASPLSSPRRCLPAQTSLAASEEKAAAEPLIDRLVNRLGARAVRRLFPRESHIPELAQSARSALARSALARSRISARNDAPAWSGQAKPPRPPLLFANPEPVDGACRDSRRTARALHLAACDPPRGQGRRT